MPTSTRYRRDNHRLQRPGFTEPQRQFICIHPSDLPLARCVWMAQTLLGFTPLLSHATLPGRLHGSGTDMGTGRGRC